MKIDQEKQKLKKKEGGSADDGRAGEEEAGADGRTAKENGRGPAEDDRGPDEDRPREAEAEEEGGQEGEVGAEDDFGERQLPAKTFLRFCKSGLMLHFILSLILLGSLQLH